MQFIVKPNNSYRLFYIKKFYRLYGQHLLYSFGFIIVFTSGLLFGLMWNFDNHCSKYEDNIKHRSSSLSPARLSSSPSLTTQSEDLQANKRESTYLVVLIVSCSINRKRRDAIRETWLKLVQERQLKYYFVIGSLEMRENESQELQKEQETFKDLLTFPQVKDTYSGLTHKLLASFKWFANNVKFTYLLKVDDDSFVQIDRVFDELAEKPKRTKFYWGWFDGRASVKTRGQWKETKWFLCDKYLPYALGGGYVLSQDLVQYIGRNSDLLQLYNSEDISVGVWLSPLAIDRVHDLRFDTEFESRGCSNSFLISHKQTVEHMRDKYNSLQSTNKLCKKEVSHKNSYIYNWNVRPSMCCIRNVSTISS